MSKRLYLLRHVPAVDGRRPASRPKPSLRWILGHPDWPKLAIAVERDVAAERAADAPPASTHTGIGTPMPEIAASLS